MKNRYYIIFFVLISLSLLLASTSYANDDVPPPDEDGLFDPENPADTDDIVVTVWFSRSAIMLSPYVV